MKEFLNDFNDETDMIVEKRDNFDSQRLQRLKRARASHRKRDDLVEEHHRGHVEVKHKILKVWYNEIYLKMFRYIGRYSDIYLKIFR